METLFRHDDETVTSSCTPAYLLLSLLYHTLLLLVFLPTVGVIFGYLTERVALRGWSFFFAIRPSIHPKNEQDKNNSSAVSRMVVQHAGPSIWDAGIRLASAWLLCKLLFFSFFFSHTSSPLPFLCILSKQVQFQQEETIMHVAHTTYSFVKMAVVCMGIRIGASLQPIGLTGGIACGKTTVCRLLQEQPWPNADANLENDDFDLDDNHQVYKVLDLDQIAREVVDPTRIPPSKNQGFWKTWCTEPSAYPAIVQTFGTSILQQPPSPPTPAPPAAPAQAKANPTTKPQHQNHTQPPKETPCPSTQKNATHPPPKIDRDKLGQIIFANPALRRRLNQLTHPLLFQILLRRLVGHSFFHRPWWVPHLVKIFLFYGWHVAGVRRGRRRRRRAQVVLVDVPLLFESGVWLRWLFGTIVVVSLRSDDDEEDDDEEEKDGSKSNKSSSLPQDATGTNSTNSNDSNNSNSKSTSKSTKEKINQLQLQRLQARNPQLSPQQCQQRIASQWPLPKKEQLADYVIYNNFNSLQELEESGVVEEVHQEMVRRHDLWSGGGMGLDGCLVLCWLFWWMRL